MNWHSRSYPAFVKRAFPWKIFFVIPQNCSIFLSAPSVASICIVICIIRSVFTSFQTFLCIFILRAAAFYRFLLKKIFMNPMLYHLLDAINFFHFNVPSFNMNFIRHKRISTCAWKFFMMEGSHMKPTTEINTTIDYRKIGVHLKEAAKRTPFRKRKLPHPCT